jgi:hypothetical protein
VVAGTFFPVILCNLPVFLSSYLADFLMSLEHANRTRESCGRIPFAYQQLGKVPLKARESFAIKMPFAPFLPLQSAQSSRP